MEDKFFRWKKGAVFDLSSSFSTHELTCQCTQSFCQDQIIAKELISKLQKVRDLLGEPIHVTSGFRCPAHQKEISTKGCETAKSISQHELGNAADIVSANLTALAKLVEKEFKAIGYSRRFFHVDLRSDKARYWIYKY